MPTLSFEESKNAKAIAIVKGGDEDGKILYLHEEDLKNNPQVPGRSTVGSIKLTDQN